MTSLINVTTIVLLFGGVVFFFGTAIGLLRFPDLFTRVHAASKGDTASSLLLLAALVVYHLHDLSGAGLLVSLKILSIGAVISVASPTAAHALTEAAFLSGARPWMKSLGSAKQPHAGGDTGAAEE